MAKLDSVGGGGGVGVGEGLRYESVVIVGSGVFGLSTALSLSLHNASLPPSAPKTKITVIDRHSFPAPDGSSIDSSRIVRADYKDPHYASLCLAAQARWRAGNGVWESLGSDGRYTESGIVMVVDKEDAGIPGKGLGGREYVQESLENMRGLLVREVGMGKDDVAKKVVGLKNKEEIRKVCGTNGGGSGVEGYVNWLSGWVDAERAMKFVRKRCEERGEVEFLVGEVVGLLEMPSGEIKGVELKDGREVKGQLTVLASGSWTTGLIDLEGRAVSTGQVLAYVEVTEEEEGKWKDIPVLWNLSTGLFLTPPRNGICKVGRHAIGYLNTQPVKLATGHKESGPVRRSAPMTALTTPSVSRIPAEGEADLRRGLREMLPALGDRPFESTRICWYTDTPTADFIVDYVPGKKGLFLATGGSGHAFKFLPVLGDIIVDIMLGKYQGVWKDKWRWRKKMNIVEGVMAKDGSRAGPRQSELQELYENEELPEM
ncbi:FAD dependent oxidoreductase [Tirmania nivea]|nr:FAD dependent oxidoreductase [Tirmania nivea]